MVRCSSIALVFCVLFIEHYSGALPSSECKEKGCATHFSCSNTKICTCLLTSSRYDLFCEKDDNSQFLEANITPLDSIRVSCTSSANSSDFGYLNGLTVGPVETVKFRLCPLPVPSISDLLSSLGTSGYTAFQFESFRNLSYAFDARHFTGFGNVTKLLLNSNNLTYLPDHFLSGVPSLTWLDLRSNNLILPDNFFDDVPHLEFLELGDNKLTELNSRTFSGLGKLQFLNLWSNKLENITDGAFSGLHSLEQLDISSNSIVSLPRKVFSNLTSLRKLSLHSNNITDLPFDLLSENQNLEVVRLHDNRQSLRLPNIFFGNLTKLREVQLMRNGIASIPEDIFRGSINITILSLEGNVIAEIPSSLFNDQRNLLNLDISKNQLENITDYTFNDLENLQNLNLSHNRLKRITRYTFVGMNSLLSLDLAHNDLHYIDWNALSHMKKLITSDFAHNHLTFLPDDTQVIFAFPGRQSPLRDCTFLEHVNLSHNSITEIFQDWLFKMLRLRTLNLSHNRIAELTMYDIQFLSDDLEVDLRHNEISEVKLDNLEALALNENSLRKDHNLNPKKTRLLLDENPLNCDCNSYELFRYLEGKLHSTVSESLKLIPGDLKCDLPISFRGVKVTEINSSDVTCDLDQSFPCPKGCGCKFRRHDFGLIVNCTGAGLREIPDSLPRMNLINHTELFLEKNRIEKLPNSTYPGYDKVTHLFLSSNNITDIGTGLLPANLTVLKIDDNNLTTLSTDTVRFLRESNEISILTLHNNPWQCDCSAREMLDLIQKKFKEIPFLEEVKCSGGKGPLSRLTVSDLCPVPMAIIVSCLVAAVFGLVMGSLAALYYRYQREVKVWLYSHRFCLWFVTEEELDRDKLYDAFVSYSHKDEDFVINTLVRELESGENPFKLCLHYRDWIAGEWIPNQIARSVENSRRTLVILSPNFLESVWSRMEFRVAHKQALSEGRARVIVVLYGDVGPTDDLDPELRAYISMNTYVKWKDPWFWEKLKYALPHPPSLLNTNSNFIKRRRMKTERHHIDDKLELMRSRHQPSTPSSGFTSLDTMPNGNSVHKKTENPLA